MAKKLRKWLQKRLNKTKIFYDEDYGFGSSQSGQEGETPLQQGHSIQVSNKTETTETVSWQNPFAVPDGYIVLYKSGSEVDTIPVDGTDYVVGAEIGTGNLVGAKVRSADSLSVLIGNLPVGTVIHYEIFAYNGSGSGIKYRTAPERGHRWTTDSAPATGMIGADINIAKTLEVRSGSTTIYYRSRAVVTDAWGAWTLWDDIVGKAFHAIKICEGGVIHDSNGDPVAMKVLVGDHLGSATAHAGYVPGDDFELVFTGAGGQTWNDIAWNPFNNNATFVSDSGTSRIATAANARTVSYSLAMDGNSIASVCHTNSATIPTLICFKNPGTSGKGIAALISGVWTLRDTTVGKTYHMIRYCPGLGGSDSRVFCSSADGTGNDALWSDDYFATKTVINITGEYGAFAFDSTNIVLAMYSRTPGADIQITVDGSNFESIDNPVADIVLFNGVADGNGFNACASSGTSLGIKTVPTNITSAETRFTDYTDWIAAIQLAGFALGTSAQNEWVKNLTYAYQDGGYRDKIKNIKVYGYGSNVDAVTFNVRNAATFRSIKVNTPTFLDGSGVRSSGTSYLRSGFTPSTHATGVNNYGVTIKCTDGSVNSKVLYGANGADTSTRNSLNVRDASGNLATTAMSNTAVAGAANPVSATGVYTQVRDGATATGHRIYKSTATDNISVIDPSGAVVGAGLSPVERFDCGLNNNTALSLADDTRYLTVIIDHDGDMTNANIQHLHNALLVPV